MLYFCGCKPGHGVDISSYGFRGYMIEHYVPLPPQYSYKVAQRKQAGEQRRLRESIAHMGKRL
jgi:hypothetical protein